uniref:PAAR domain-containing protein n=1 Tax=Burkholderia arboris TaxID=488730 RepID=UPI003BEEB1FC
MTKLIIRRSDKTDHGGTVLEGFDDVDLGGQQAAGVGHMVWCPKCGGMFPIVQGSSSYAIDGRAVALDGMKTACGASLIASQQTFLASP